MSAKALLKKLDAYEATIAGMANEPQLIRIVSPEEFELVPEDDNVLYIEDIDLEPAYQPPTPADQGRYLQELGL